MKKVLRDELTEMIATDKATRKRLWEALQAHGHASDVFAKAKEEVAEASRRNVARLVSILDAYGWPGKSMVGEDASTGAFLVLQHADLEVQLKYLPLLQQAAEAEEVEKKAAAFLQDRILVRQGKPQLYGTQLRQASDGKPELYPIKDEARVDERRADLGLSNLAEYREKAGLGPEDGKSNE